MMWLFRVKRPHDAPNIDELMRDRRRMVAEVRETILRQGDAQLFPSCNVAPGTFGHTVLTMEFEGLLRGVDVRTGPLQGEVMTRYTLTHRGEQMAAMMRDDPLTLV